MISRRSALRFSKHSFRPIGVSSHRPNPPPPLSSSSPTSASLSSGGKVARAPSQYQLQLQDYVQQLRWFYSNPVAPSPAPPPPASAASPTSTTPKAAGSGTRRRGILLSATTLFFIPYLIVDDWLDHLYASRTRKRLVDARTQSTKCKVIDVRRHSN